MRSSASPVTIRLTIVDMQPITPAIGGGRLRLLGLYHALGPEFKTTYVGTYDWPGEQRRELRLTGSLTEIDVPLSTEHFRCDAQWRDLAGGVTTIDTAFPMLGRLSKDFLDCARVAIVGADAVVFEHPWVHPLLADVVDRSRQLLVYDSQNVEALLRYDILGDTPFGREIAKGVAMTESFLARDADVVVGCSAEDVSFYHDAYGVPRERMWVVPNGVFVKAIVAPSPRERVSAKAALAIAGQAVVFIGSNYGPNVAAAEFIRDRIAPALPEVTFLVCGGVGDAASVRSVTRPNVHVTGRVSDEEKLRLLHAADVALNPMFSGSGTNIKMFDFMAAGLPVVSTVTGARGICDTTTRGIAVCAPESITGELARLVEDAASRQRLGADNRRWVERDFSWEALSPMFGAIVRRALERRAVATPARQTKEPAAGTDARGVAGQLATSGTAVPRLGILSTLGIQCGIAEYTTYLTEALLATGAEVTIFANLLDGHEASMVPLPAALEATAVERVWRYDNATWTQSSVNAAEVARLLHVHTISHFNVQYHRGFFPEPMLLELLRTVTAIGATASVSLHSSRDATPGLLTQLATMPVAVLVHCRAEQDRLRGLGIARAQFVPIGIRPATTVENPGFPFTSEDADPVLATFGFLRPHKGLLELVEAVQILRGVFSGIRLLAQTALYPSTDSTDYLERVRARIAELGLGEAVHLDHSFVDINVAIARLARVKAIVLPYGVSDEGASAAAATALAARRPLITTQARIFEEVRGVAYMAEDNSPPVLAAAIAAVLSIPGLCRHLENQSNRAAEARQWRNIAQLLLRIMDGRCPAAESDKVPAPGEPSIVSPHTS
jgi:glycosyltransferase involved in cell wall biosynthesis